MTAELQYLLSRLEQVENDQPADHPLERLNRDESENLNETERLSDTELQRANVVSVGVVDSANSVRGHEYNLDTDVICSVRIEGLHYLKHGHIDPDGTNGRQWHDSYTSATGGSVDTQGLVNEIRDRILADRTHPNVSGPDSYRHLLIDDDPQAPDFGDYYRHDITVTFVKAEEP